MNAVPVHVLLVDDEPAIRRLLRTGLTSQGYSISEAGTAAEARAQIVSGRPDLVILDLGLPDGDGEELLAEWRAAGIDTPIVVLSGRSGEAGIVEALEIGADDYVTKPFGIQELLARLRVALRHRLQQQGERPIFQSGELTVDLVRRIVRLRGEEVRLSPKEYEILRALVQHAGKVLTHRHLLHEVWGNAQDPQYLRVYVRQLRQKIEDNPEQPNYIRTETGVGYRFREADR